MRLFDATSAVVLATVLATPALACCSYGCCDCSCVAAVPDDHAKRIINELSSILEKEGYDPKTIELTVRHDDGLIVLQQNESGLIEQPAPEQSK